MTAKKRGPGRPKSEDEPADELCRFKCTATERRRIEALAAERGMRLSEYLRGKALCLF